GIESGRWMHDLRVAAVDMLDPVAHDSGVGDVDRGGRGGAFVPTAERSTRSCGGRPYETPVSRDVVIGDVEPAGGRVAVDDLRRCRAYPVCPATTAADDYVRVADHVS